MSTTTTTINTKTEGASEPLKLSVAYDEKLHEDVSKETHD